MADILKEQKNKAYNDYVKKVTPTHSLWSNMWHAFVTGGAICVLGQFIINTAMNLGADKKLAGTWCSVLLVLISVILTGCGIYQRLAKFGGAGTLVPITGFANAIVSPAMEFKSEGLILGLGAKLFVIAGPVLVYGMGASVLYGIVYCVSRFFTG